MPNKQNSHTDHDTGISLCALENWDLHIFIINFMLVLDTQVHLLYSVNSVYMLLTNSNHFVFRNARFILLRIIRLPSASAIFSGPTHWKRGWFLLLMDKILFLIKTRFLIQNNCISFILCFVWQLLVFHIKTVFDNCIIRL